jgi:FecR protein
MTSRLLGLCAEVADATPFTRSLAQHAEAGSTAPWVGRRDRIRDYSGRFTVTARFLPDSSGPRLGPMATRLHALRVLNAALLTSATLALPVTARAAESQVGTVAMLLGTATVTRAALPAPVPLSFKDDVFLRDRITTAEKSAVRVLLGGKATVTARELSVLTITEVPGTSTVSLTTGRTAVAVSKTRMKPGETLEIKTPNVVVAVRGTFVIAEVSPGRSRITILRGLVEVTKLDPATGRPVGPAVKVGALERVTVTDAGPVPAPQAITPEAATTLASDFTFLPRDTPAASMAALNEEVKKASMSAVTHTVTGLSPPAIGTLSGGATGAGGLSARTQGIGAAAGSTTATDGSVPISPTVTPDVSVPSPLIPAVTPTVNGLLPSRRPRP